MLPIRKVGTGGAFISEIQPVVRPPFGEAALSFHSAASHKRALIGLCSQAARGRVTPQKITSKAPGFPTRAGQGREALIQGQQGAGHWVKAVGLGSCLCPAPGLPVTSVPKVSTPVPCHPGERSSLPLLLWRT